MNSWDCFDTLIARRFYKTENIWKEAGQRLGILDFVQQRRLAERVSDGTYASIYNHLPGINPEIERQVELEHSFPILESVRHVQQHDVVVSDTYHDVEFVTQLLSHCGINGVKVYATPNGKREGWIWKQVIDENGPIDMHTGDNSETDINSAKQANLPAVIFKNSQWSSIEHQIAPFDYDLACWMRYVRIGCPYTDPISSQIWIDQSQINLPILALATLELPDTDLAFIHRDGVNWQPLYEAMTNRTAVRFDSSRRCMLAPTPDYREYALTTVGNRMIVDLHGTGSSIKALFGETHPSTRITGSGNNRMIEHDSDSLEKFNCASIGSLIGWDNGPVRAELEYDINIANIQQEAMEYALLGTKWFTPKSNTVIISYLFKNIAQTYTDRFVKIIDQLNVVQ